MNGGPGSSPAVPPIAVATVAAKNYLARVRVLAASFREFHPSIPFFLLLADEVDGYFDTAKEPFTLLDLAEVGIPDLDRMRSRYGRKQMAAAAKPFLLEHLLNRGFPGVVFLDPDIMVLDSLDEVFARVCIHTAVLTPHLLVPPASAEGIERELTILQSGAYNAGLIGTSERPEARRFLTWWQRRVREHCRYDLGHGLYYDQHWLDLAAVFFDDIHALRDPGCNVAYWNLPEREVRAECGGFRVDGVPLRFMHFSGFDPDQPDTLTCHSDRLDMAQIGDAAPLFRNYAARLAASGHRETQAWPYAYKPAAEVAKGTGPVLAGRSSRQETAHDDYQERQGAADQGRSPRQETPLDDSREQAADSAARPGHLCVSTERTSDAAVGTIAAKRHLALVRVLAASFRKQHPDIPFYVLLADEIDGYFAPEREPFRLLRLDEVGIPDLPRLRFKYTQPELTYAATPYLLRHLLDRGFGRAAFLKQESMVLGDLSPVLAMLARHSVLLTPHLLSPLEGEEGIEREANILQSGIYNVGFLGVADRPEGRRFLEWWQARLQEHCRHDVPHGMHFEQRWLDLVPVYFNEVGIVRDPGFNIGHWNLPERQIRLEGEAMTVDGLPARYLRLSGFDPGRPDAVTRYSPRLNTEKVGAAAGLFRSYVQLLDAAGHQQAGTWPYAYDYFDNGSSVTDEARRLYRDLGAREQWEGDPLSTRGRHGFYAWLAARRRREAPWRLWQALRDRFPVRTTLRRWLDRATGVTADRKRTRRG